MKSTTVILALLIAGMVLAITTKPGDQECISELRDKAASSEGELAAILTVNRHTLMVEDRIFFKAVYSIDGHMVGYGAFWHVWEWTEY